jgi:hypothetical protein
MAFFSIFWPARALLIQIILIRGDIFHPNVAPDGFEFETRPGLKLGELLL